MPTRTSEPRRDLPPELGVSHTPAGERGLTPADVIAFGLSLVWVLLFGWLFWRSDAGSGGAEQTAMVLIAIVLPVALIWLAALALRSTRAMRKSKLWKPKPIR